MTKLYLLALLTILAGCGMPVEPQRHTQTLNGDPCLIDSDCGGDGLTCHLQICMTDNEGAR